MGKLERQCYLLITIEASFFGKQDGRVVGKTVD